MYCVVCCQVFKYIKVYCTVLRRVLPGVQVHQFQQDDDAAVLHPVAVCQGPGRLRDHVLHRLPRLHAARLPALRHHGQGLQQLPERLVSGLGIDR